MATNDIYLRPDAGDGTNGVRLRTDAPSGGGSPVNYALTCAVGSYTIAGQAATLTVGRKLALDAGAYAVAGQAATLTVARRLTLNPGSYAVTGQAATLDYVPGVAATDYVLALDAGAYTAAGQTSDLTYTPGTPAAPPPITYWDVMLGGSQTPIKKKQKKQELEAMLLLLG